MRRSIPLALAAAAFSAALAPGPAAAADFGFTSGPHHGASRPGAGGPGFGFTTDRRGRRGSGYRGNYLFYPGLGLVEEVPPDAGGYFEQGAARRRGDGSGYDYDRSYPYDYPRSQDAREPAAPAAEATRGPRCTVEQVSGGPVRVCRR